MISIIFKLPSVTRDTSYTSKRKRGLESPRRAATRGQGSHMHTKTYKKTSRHRFFRRFFDEDEDEAAAEASRTRAISSVSRRTTRQTRRDVTTSRAGGKAPS